MVPKNEAYNVRNLPAMRPSRVSHILTVNTTLIAHFPLLFILTLMSPWKNPNKNELPSLQPQLIGPKNISLHFKLIKFHISVSLRGSKLHKYYVTSMRSVEKKIYKRVT